MRTRIIAAVLGLVAVLIMLTGLSLVAAQTSLPESPLYGMKLLGEDIQQKLAGDNASLMLLIFSYIERRFEEIGLSLQTSGVVPQKAVSRLQIQLDQYFQLAATHDETVQNTALMRIYEVLIVQETILSSQQNQLQTEPATQMGEVLTMLGDRRKLVEYGLQNPSTFRTQMLTGEMPADESDSHTALEFADQPETQCLPTLSSENTPMPELSTTDSPMPTESPTPEIGPTSTSELDDVPPGVVVDKTSSPEPTVPEEEVLPPGFEGTPVTITPGGIPEEEDDLPPGIGDGPVYTATVSLEEEEDDNNPPGIGDSPVYTATVSQGEEEDDDPPPEVNP